MAIRGLHHVAIHTRDLDCLAKFYIDIVGFEAVPDSVLSWESDQTIDAIIDVPGSSARTLMLRAGTIYLELFQYIEPKAPDRDRPEPYHCGYTHICLDSDDVDADFVRLSAGGMHFPRPPVVAGKFRTIYGRDPDGNIVELQQVDPSASLTLDKLKPSRTTPSRATT